MERNKHVVHCSMYMNKALCGVLLLDSAIISTDIERITCETCKKVAIEWEEKRYRVTKLRVVK